MNITNIALILSLLAGLAGNGFLHFTGALNTRNQVPIKFEEIRTSQNNYFRTGSISGASRTGGTSGGK